MVRKNDQPVVIGGGAAGIAACLTLEAAGFAPLLLEATGRLGGRLRTERMSDGTPVDAGFQVLLTAYPELKRWVDMEALDPVRFVPGARILKRGRWRTVADPRRRPELLLQTLTSGIGTLPDWVRTLRLAGRVMSGSPIHVQSMNLKGSSMDFLLEKGFSEGFIEDFFRPFFSGIFLDEQLSPPPAQLAYTFRMFAEGDAVRPKGGMEALVDHLQGKLKRTEVRFHHRVVSLQEGNLALEGSEGWAAQNVICTLPHLLDAQPVGEWNGCLNAVFESRGGFGSPIIGLLPEAGAVTNFHFMEDVQGEEGKGKVNATAILKGGADSNQLIDAMAMDLRSAGIPVGECLWHASIPRALPRMTSVAPALNHPRVMPGVWLAGDATAAPSLDAALRSGRVAAESLVESTNRARP